MVHDGPAEAMLGSVDANGMPMHQMWSDPVTETPNVGDTEVWEFYNFTADAHPMHVHEIVFEVVNREGLVLTMMVRQGVPMKRTGDVRASGALGELASKTQSLPTRAR